MFLRPAIALMQRLRLFPKFLIVAVLFSLPAILMTGLLIRELNKSISFSQSERLGVLQLQAAQELLKLTQLHRALRHLALAGNAPAKEDAGKVQQEINSKISAFDKLQKVQLEMGLDASFIAIKQSWESILQKLPASKNKESYTDHSLLIAQLYKLNTQIADRSHLTLDPEVGTYYLISLFAKNLPELADGISDIAGRGASYIDTGLLEANEDLLISSDVMLAKRDVNRIPVLLEAMYRANPGFKTKLDAQQAVLASNLEFLERTKNEVLNTLNQTSGTEFLKAGIASVNGWYAYANATGALLDASLEERLQRDILHRNMLIAVISLILIIAAYLLAGFYVSFSGEVQELSEAVQRVAAGDLSTRISSHGKDEIAQLLNAFEEMSQGLGSLVANIRSGTETIATASQEIAHGNADLSTRTEQQAGSLEETSASMQELTNAVKQNAIGAEQANGNALFASDIAREGGVAVERVIDTMRAIEQSSKKISDIIGVIDGIAFQTNILALNAAVEAARAGEQGRGFAVVASEVRNLAQRSAGAAKEIKQLITASVEQVSVGSKQVQAAGATMEQIVNSIQSVTDAMEEITTASAEQRSGIEHVNDALSQMDNITQQNAALVEQAAAAAESMHDQALKLSQAVAVFRIHDAGPTNSNEGETGQGSMRKSASPQARQITKSKLRLANAN
ncbi:methyl-accepting chemotaxis protein [Undibacterium sp. KW1]|uniref:methyl-accepting chemotaxis protein n=1 Tax=Undibacterium sp. KW1 TaxID=2058624 RepID=UPI00272BD35E|nr:methyl-accepting chemotaxis protein [Undibacterium sp. KW1]